MTRGTLDDEYLPWLYGQVADIRDRASSRSYRVLFKELFSLEFIWTITHDENRAADGLALRDEWMSQTRIQADDDWLALGCSFLEMLVALARRIAFETGETSEYWFWHILGNLDLNATLTVEEIRERANRVINRTYDRKGHGGLFPLQRTPRYDPRRQEIWYQFHTYILNV